MFYFLVILASNCLVSTSFLTPSSSLGSSRYFLFIPRFLANSFKFKRGFASFFPYFKEFLWITQVNISPSLHSSSSLDLDVKSPLATGQPGGLMPLVKYKPQIAFSSYNNQSKNQSFFVRSEQSAKISVKKKIWTLLIKLYLRIPISVFRGVQHGALPHPEQNQNLSAGTFL